mmetsp:Transcript_22467/g.60754  ORF Transcript_22467/g.60754 Transcript_22467/m.60754 type:complete len:439 (-) Transcript_22467:428-1744(-)
MQCEAPEAARRIAEEARADVSKCPVMRLALWLRALLALALPAPALAAVRRNAPARHLPLGSSGHEGKRPPSAFQCPFLRLMVVFGMQVAVTAAASPPCVRTTRFAVPAPRHVTSMSPPRSARANRLAMNADSSPAEGSRVLVLGGGWVGSRVANHLAEQGAQVMVTHRDLDAVDAKKPYFKPADLPKSIPRFQFEFERQASWVNLPDPAGISAVIVTFPITDVSLANEFHEAYLSRVPNAIVCSSTSVYEVLVPNQYVTESTPLKADTARGHAEEALRAQGVTLLALGGIFGSGTALGDISERSVCSCFAMHTAHAPVSSARKLVNMVHISDILVAMSQLCTTPLHGERINAVSCTYELRSLLEHCGLSEANVDDTLPPDTSSKFICNKKLADLLAKGGNSLYEPATALPRHELAGMLGLSVRGANKAPSVSRAAPAA